MPVLKTHLLFDKFLKNKDIVWSDTDGTAVHKRLDFGAKRFGANHREEDYYHSVEAIRVYVEDISYNLTNMLQATKTDFIRIAWGHIILDQTATRLRKKINCKVKDIGLQELIKPAYRSYRRNGCHKTYFKSIF